MTRIIIEGIEQQTFSTLKFYVSRANRIIPALGVFCLVIAILAYFFLPAIEYKTIGRDIATSMFFVSNVMFSIKGDYFSSGYNFLLHTWSLSVEWQFYIIYPLVLIVLRKLFSLKLLKAICLHFRMIIY